jgi:hypothetical protein
MSQSMEQSNGADPSDSTLLSWRPRSWNHTDAYIYLSTLLAYQIIESTVSGDIGYCPN